MASLPRPLAAAGVWVLRTEGLRMAANRMAYHDQALATQDAMRVGRLHTHLDGWCAAGARAARMRAACTQLYAQATHAQPFSAHPQRCRPQQNFCC